MYDRLRDANTLPIPMGKVLCELVMHRRQLRVLLNFAYAFVHAIQTKSLDLPDELQVLPDSHVSVERRSFRQVAYPFSDFVRICCNTNTSDLNFTRRRVQISSKYPEECSLSRTVQT